MGKKSIEKDVRKRMLGVGGVDVTKDCRVFAWLPASDVTDGGMACMNGIQHGREGMAKAMGVEWRCGRSGGVEHAAEAGKQKTRSKMLRVVL